MNKINWLTNIPIAHRGLHNAEFPENSIGAMENAFKHGYAIETDLQILADGTVVLFHDRTTGRMCGEDAVVSQLTKQDLARFKLNGTEQTIPTLEQLLEAADGKHPLLLEVKNYDPPIGVVESAMMLQLKDYKGEYVIEAFNPYCLIWFKNNYPDVPRGQLSCDFKKEKLEWYKKFILKRLLLNGKTKPHFIAYDFKGVKKCYVKKWRKKIPLVCWTIRTQEEYDFCKDHCDNVIFENLSL